MATGLWSGTLTSVTHDRALPDHRPTAPAPPSSHQTKKRASMTDVTFDDRGPALAARPSGIRQLWDRRLAHYPETAARTLYLGITVLATIVLYYQLNVQGAVATHVL